MAWQFYPSRGGSAVLLMLSALTARAENLQQAWDVALQADQRLHSAQLLSRGAEQGVAAAQSARLPNLQVGAGYSVLDNTPAVIVNLPPLPQIEMPMAQRDSLAYQASVSLPLYTGGRISGSIDGARAQHAAAIANEASTQQQIKLDVATAYITVLRAQRGVEVAASAVRNLEAHEYDVGNFLKKELVTRNDLLSVQVALADMRQQLLRATNGLSMARAAYNRLLGRAMDETVALDDIAANKTDTALVAATNTALRQRAELQALSRQSEALRQQADVVRAEEKPQVALNLNYNYQENRYQVHEGLWAAGIGMKWELFDGGLRRHQAAAWSAKAESTLAQHADVASQIELQVRNAWLNQQETQARIPVAEKAVQQAEENFAVNRHRYREGLGTNTEVLDAETLRSRSDANYYNAIYDAALSELQLRYAMGEL